MSETIKKEIKDSGDRTIFVTGAQRDQQGDKGAFSLLPFGFLRALAIHYQKGAKKYKKRNWELGMPISQYFDSGPRHLGQWVEGFMDEYNHPIACIWNLACAYQTILWIQEGKLPLDLYDMPNKLVLPDPYGRPEYTFNSWEEVEARWKDKWSNKEYKIIINGETTIWKHDFISYEDVVFASRLTSILPSQEIVFTVMFSKGTVARPQGTLIKGEKVNVGDGMVFDVANTSRA